MTGWNCKNCNSELQYSDRWDAKYCSVCDEWSEPRCSCKPEDNALQMKCYFECWDRPEKPSMELKE